MLELNPKALHPTHPHPCPHPRSQVAEWRQLAAVAALVRYAEDPQWVGIEWTDGPPLTIYVTPAREALLAALLDATQVRGAWARGGGAVAGRNCDRLFCLGRGGNILLPLRGAHAPPCPCASPQAAAGRAIALLPQPTGPGEVILSGRAKSITSAAVAVDAELEKVCMGQLHGAARDFVASGAPALPLAVLAAAGLTGGEAVGGGVDEGVSAAQSDAGSEADREWG
jgi:hypothetical protein